MGAANLSGHCTVFENAVATTECDPVPSLPCVSTFYAFVDSNQSQQTLVQFDLSPLNCNKYWP